MVHAYKTNKEFIVDVHGLLEKFDKKGLWNKNTLVIGLDKSVRPLAYTLRKLSGEEGRETPDIRFFNYSHIDYVKLGEDKSKEIMSRLHKRFNKDSLKEYDKILLIEEYAHTGNSLKDIKNFLEQGFSKLKKSPKIYLSSLNINDLEELKIGKNNIIYESSRKYFPRAMAEESGIVDKDFDINSPEVNNIYESKRVENHETYKKFIQNRSQLSKDIKEYLHEKHPENISKKPRTLEKIVSGIFVFSFLAGLFLSSNNLTGNIIGNSESAHKLLGIILIFVGIFGFFIYRRKLK